MITLKAEGLEGSGPGIFRVGGSFTTLSNGTPTKIRPSKGNFTVTRKAQGVYVINYQQAGLSIANAAVNIGPTAALAGQSVDVNPPGFATLSADFLTTNSNGTQYAADATNRNVVLLVFSSPTSSSLVDVYGLGNQGGVAKYRVNFELMICASTMNQ